ncbi:aminotransferase class IV [Geomicrobium sp. JCM 19037]|uniref:aminotransferase class IV n=1 Tax=Geomicrobium sp. JCM 19037 TaxID=1460634 RepID=UPI001EE66DE0|nr:aminotransferase class IV [Geomicrobium sp. JCM 19037]
MLLKEGRYARLNEHLERLAESQMTFLRSLDEDNIKMALLEYAESLDHSTTYKVRLVVGPTGEWSISHHRIEHSGIRTVERVGWGTRPVHRGDLFLRHKTTLRSVYEERRLPNVFDVLLYNDENEVTEFTIGNVVAKVNGKYVTPPLESGCLPGVFRRHLLQQGTIEEQVLTVDDVSFADELWLINSVREWVKVRLS